MNFNLDRSIEILERTPAVLTALLQGISEEWTAVNEGGESWSAYAIVGHLIHGEKTDWIPRVAIILDENADKNFDVFDRLAQFEAGKTKTLEELLVEFKSLREEGLHYLRSQHITAETLSATGTHPAFGEVSLSQLLATWVVHDLNHLAQISRVMAKQYQHEVGPWIAYLGILKQ
ncbi:MAG: DinB family protein [Bacteroidota bacterium]